MEHVCFIYFVRLISQIQRIVEKYTDPDGNYVSFPYLTNQKYNAYLKEIGDILGLDITLTTHIGRKTFGTIALNNGYSIESVSRMLGHTNIRTTQNHYAVLLRKKVISENSFNENMD